MTWHGITMTWQVLLNRNMALDVMSQATGVSIDKLAEDTNRCKYMDAEAALAYGIIDQVRTRLDSPRLDSTCPCAQGMCYSMQITRDAPPPIPEEAFKHQHDVTRNTTGGHQRLRWRDQPGGGLVFLSRHWLSLGAPSPLILTFTLTLTSRRCLGFLSCAIG